MKLPSLILIMIICNGCSYAQKKVIVRPPAKEFQDFNPQSIIVEGVVVSILPVDTTQKQYPLNKYPSKAVIKILSTGRKGRSYNGSLPSKINQEVTMFFPMTTRATHTLYTKKELKTKTLFTGLTVGQKITAEAYDTQETLDDLPIPRVISYQ